MAITCTSNDEIDYPYERCPYCGAQALYMTFDEWESTGAPTEPGTHVHCKNERFDDPHDHCAMPYVYWMPVITRAARWAAQHVVICDRDDQRALAAWNAGEPIRR